MDDEGESHEPWEWQPAISEPFELLTAEGRRKALRVEVRGLRNTDPRFRQYRRDMARTGVSIIVGAMAIGLRIAVITAVL